MTHDPTFWLLARASGFTAYAFLTFSVLAGLVLKSRPFGTAIKPAWMTGLHRTLALTAIGALGAHATAIVLDTTVKVSPLGLIVPGLAGYRPLATALGVLAAELTIAVYVSFSIRKRIGTRNWRRLHWATYGIFAAATAHGLAAGTDTSRPWAFLLYLGATGAVAAATAWRGLSRRPARQRTSPQLKGEPA